jgi:hypothetical protein
VAFALRCNKKLKNIVDLTKNCTLFACAWRTYQRLLQQKMHRNMVSATLRVCPYSGAVVSAQSVNKLSRVTRRREEPNVLIERLAD